MSWLYEHREQLDGLKPLVEIAHWAVIPHVPPEDQDDVEQEIVIRLMQTIEKYGNKGKAYLKAVARYRIYAYYRVEYQRKRLCYIDESEGGERAGGTLVFLRDGDGDARLDANTTLATLPERLIQIGHKLLNGEKLSESDQVYWRRQKAKLNCRKYGNRLSDWEKRRILQLHREGVSISQIARTMGRTNKPITKVLIDLAGYKQLSRQDRLDEMKRGEEGRDERIRHAYFVEGKSINQITKIFHHDHHTVRRVISLAE